ncbi:MAG: response regulator [Proteobacteria bacterium]|nr:response regulator [Pseudomonadota bacterium]
MPQVVSLTHHKIRVLLVDDQTIIGEAVRRMLAPEQDIEFHFCQDPTQAIRMANTLEPTVILQDLVMPEVDGLTLVRYFRANGKTRQVPLIVLSGREEPLTKAEAFALGANDYMVKLPDKLEVIARIRYHSNGYITLLQRNEAFERLEKSQKELEKRNQFIRQTFGRYLSDDIVDSILETPQGMRLGGETRTVTIMMTDLRGFTAIGERLPPENVVGMLNIYLEIMTGIILKYQGTIDEFIGDAILVIFGAPILRDNDAARAVACALEMQIAMEEVNARNREAGYPEVAMGIGLNTGEVVVGNIGSKKRVKYGVVGKNVNLTSRIESYTVGGQTFISPATRQACGDVLRIDDEMEVMPKGVQRPITIYEVGGIGGDYSLFLPEKKPMEFADLSASMEILFRVLSGKDASEEPCRGTVMALCGQGARIRAQEGGEKLSNVKITLFDGNGNEITQDLYAKTLDGFSESSGFFTVCFTSVPPEAEAYFQSVLTECSS